MYHINTVTLKEESKLYLNSQINTSVDDDNLEYAFYLYKDDVKSDVQWYSSNKNFKIDISTNTGIYHVVAFIRAKNSLESSRLYSPRFHHNEHPYMIENWSKNSLRKIDVDSFSEQFSFEDGVYQFDYNGQNIDFLIDGAERYKDKKEILVCFNAAVSPRGTKAAPFFSGMKVAKDLDMPLIAISDPSLALSFDIALGWYAGNKQANELTKFIANILDLISESMDSTLVLFGGSGGGFASLSVIPYMNRIAYAVVWNPQTSISRYNADVVLEYLSVCFELKKAHTDLYQILEETGVVHDLIKLYKNINLNGSKILYLQNLGDVFHLENHAKPLMSALDVKEYKNGIFHSPKGISFWLNNWADGHIIPSMDIILQSLRDMTLLKDDLKVALKL